MSEIWSVEVVHKQSKFWAATRAFWPAWLCMESVSWPQFVSLVTCSILNQMMWFKVPFKALMAYFKMHEVVFKNSIWIKRYKPQHYAHHLFVKITQRKCPENACLPSLGQILCTKLLTQISLKWCIFEKFYTLAIL